MAEDKEFLEELLQVILDEPELTIVDSVPQKKVGNTAGRSLILDAFCKLGDNRLVNIEVQTSNKTDHGRRVRYHASLITTNNTPPNQLTAQSKQINELTNQIAALKQQLANATEKTKQ